MRAAFLLSAVRVHMPNTIEESFQNGTLSIRVKIPRLDAAASREFKSESAAAWRPNVSAVVIDLGAVDFLDSAGVGALLSIHKRLPAEKPGAKLINLRPPVQAVIELLRLHRIFEIAG